MGTEKIMIKLLLKNKKFIQNLTVTTRFKMNDDYKLFFSQWLLIRPLKHYFYKSRSRESGTEYAQVECFYWILQQLWWFLNFRYRKIIHLVLRPWIEVFMRISQWLCFWEVLQLATLIDRRDFGEPNIYCASWTELCSVRSSASYQVQVEIKRCSLSIFIALL